MARREEALADFERSGGIVKRKNWPKLRPLIYLDIDAEVPAERQRMVKNGLFAWYVAAAAYSWNFIVMLIALFSGEASVGDWFMAALVSAVGLPASFIFWCVSLVTAIAHSLFLRTYA